ncbi:MAG: NADH-quinone oxidoreductase subunit NuoK [Dehalobacter sp. 4CP]|uniref:NADH-quinone oxidoreductase subunit NuoK n=1 Tax=unclassified Dehalobacter TaxID=2635733 RepID=UPI000E6D5244|nr:MULTISPECIES: NADH-quinone oxidoreductase subunit NuoK [unclassified Dehalobacter]MCM1567710.1 NADH-quinone oxidoreductase subunit NuoK [Dehalobacter sp.]NBJ14476.1 NADH-quinone oxidoreductase subunit NuoK [Dehalobacter sp. 4CP]RJE49314.1 NADH-quinone oxidoreductase subunit K [Dehalobacter sp. MCB1]TCX53363.1 NADH-quinone oxidoreductase subunit NuoK [Dehalobacter sp. 14DCB1]TCX54377.1 NADH-quinone oxidoreductase subunit NuoK [Dehalobacter sp. 12DCB1]
MSSIIHFLFNIGLPHFLILSGTLFFIGLFSVLAKRNLIAILMGMEIMLSSVNINLVAFNRYTTAPALHGHVFALFVIALAAAEVSVGLALIISVYRQHKSVEADDIDSMKW